MTRPIRAIRVQTIFALIVLFSASIATAQSSQPDVLFRSLPPVAEPLAPLAWPAATILPVTIPNWLPRAEPLPQPRTATAERSTRPIRRPVVDAPPLAQPPIADLAVTLPSYPRAWAPSNDPTDLTSLSRRVRPDRGRIELSSDVTQEDCLRMLLGNTAGQRTKPAGFVRLMLPMLVDRDAMPVRTRLADNDAPVVVSPPMPPVRLPMEK